jgi:hypothetical protein
MAKKKRYYSSMMPDGMGQHANMPQQSFVKEYPKTPYVSKKGYGDTLSAIDRQIAMDIMKARGMDPKGRF